MYLHGCHLLCRLKWRHEAGPQCHLALFRNACELLQTIKLCKIIEHCVMAGKINDRTVGLNWDETADISEPGHCYRAPYLFRSYTQSRIRWIFWVQVVLSRKTVLLALHLQVYWWSEDEKSLDLVCSSRQTSIIGRLPFPEFTNPLFILNLWAFLFVFFFIFKILFSLLANVL